MLWVLVKFGVQPIGWVRCRCEQFGRQITPDMLASLISETLSLQLHDAARGHLGPPRPKNTGRRPSVSVVVCTREHPDQLERQLNSLAKLRYDNFEVIVI